MPAVTHGCSPSWAMPIRQQALYHLQRLHLQSLLGGGVEEVIRTPPYLDLLMAMECVGHLRWKAGEFAPSWWWIFPLNSAGLQCLGGFGGDGCLEVVLLALEARPRLARQLSHQWIGHLKRPAKLQSAQKNNRLHVQLLPLRQRCLREKAADVAMRSPPH